MLSQSAGSSVSSPSSDSPQDGLQTTAATQKTATRPTAPPKQKQKRNKPTLSCLACVERKTKCDRARPCLACVKRSSSCQYTAVANLIAQNRHVKPVKPRRPSHHSPDAATKATDNGWSHIDKGARQIRHVPGMIFSGTGIDHSTTPSNVFGIGAQHPFSNYWTCQGGVPEVISVLPPKSQADVLLRTYFESVDPVYPFLHRRSFYADYERFWLLGKEDQAKIDPSLLALFYAVFALGTQFLTYPAFEERSQTAEFYCSAAHQALRVYSYLNRTSLRAISAMMLITYFLMNDNHTSDAFAWAGIHLRQCYAMRLHRDPEIVVPDASRMEQQQRRKLWSAVVFHDVMLTVLLKLPPTATHSDVPIESLSDENELQDDYDVDIGAQRRVENLMSISIIAPQESVPHPPPQPHHVVSQKTSTDDIAYTRSMWHLAELVQETISSPNSLSLPLASSPRHKDQVVSAFKRLHKSFPAHLNVTDFAKLQGLSRTNARVVRQNLFLTSNYYHCLMMLQASDNVTGGVQCNSKAALEAAHEAIHAFFRLWQIFPSEAAVWWVFQHRAFEEGLMIAHLLSLPETNADEPIFAAAKQDVLDMIQIMDRYGGAFEMHEARKAVLRENFQKIIV